jgi:hypothetical protein
MTFNPDGTEMYIVAIGWAYVILMMAVTASSVGKALAILIFLGALPLALLVYVAGGRKRPRSVALSDEVANQRNAADPQSD